MGKKLIELKEYNQQRRKTYRRSKEPVPNGIACPECGKEMVDTHPGVTLMSLPPKKDIHCPECGYKDYRVK